MGYSHQQDRSYAATILLDELTPNEGLTVLRQDATFHRKQPPTPGLLA